MKKIKRAALYARLSQSAEESVSITRQLRELREDAEQAGFEVIVTGVDDSVRASRVPLLDRNGWRAIEDYADQIDLVMIWELSRAIRTMTDWGRLQEWLTKHNASLRTHRGDLSLDDPNSEFQANILASVARMESRLTSERVKGMREQLVLDGRQGGGVRPWWAITAPHPSGKGLVLRPDPARAEVLREVVERLLDGASLRSEVLRLEREGVQPKGKHWTVTGLKSILTSPSIFGGKLHRGDVVRGDDGLIRIDPDQAVLSMSKYEELRRLLDSRKRGTRSVPSSRRAPLHGLLICSTCGNRMTSRVSRSMYQCSRDACTQQISITFAPAWEQYVGGWLARYAEAQVENVATEVDRSELIRLQDALQAAELALGKSRGTAVQAAVEEVERIEALIAAEEERVLGATPSSKWETWEESHGTGQTWGEQLQAAATDEEKAAILRFYGVRAEVLPGKRGHVVDRLRWIDDH